MRFQGTAWRAHHPMWSFRPLSGEGAAISGGRFNFKDTPALYLSLSPMTALKEASQGLAFKIDPCVLCAYEVDCDDVADLRSEAGATAEGIDANDLSCAWLSMALKGQTPPSWRLASRLLAEGRAGALVPGFAPGADADDHNLVLWRWGPDRPYKVDVFDPSGRLPKDQLSWS